MSKNMKTYKEALRRYFAGPSPETATNLPYLEGLASTIHRPVKKQRVRSWVLIVMIGVLVVLSFFFDQPRAVETDYVGDNYATD